MSVIELQNYLHLPIRRAKIIHFLLFRSFVTPFNFIVILLFAPVYWTEVQHVHGTQSILWLLTIIGLSWSLHWFMMWFKQKWGNRVVGILIIFGIFTLAAGSAWYGWFNIDMWFAPFFNNSLHSFIPLLLVMGICGSSYRLAFQYYYNHAYLEELSDQKNVPVLANNLTFFNRFGLAGTMADLELKLILRHKRSRIALILSVLFLAYGLIFYPDMASGNEIPEISIFIGTFITGIFVMNYGQLFISWNAAYFDFFLEQNNGIESLIKGKHLLLCSVSLICFLLSIPYVYFGWTILLVHTSTFLFNIGINLHVIIYLALWNPKPIDLNKRGMFNYEGVGMAQFLMVIPLLGLPYGLYFLFSWFFSDALGIAALAFSGVLGIIFHENFVAIHVRKIHKTKYAISSSFRQEL